MLNGGLRVGGASLPAKQSLSQDRRVTGPPQGLLCEVGGGADRVGVGQGEAAAGQGNSLLGWVQRVRLSRGCTYSRRTSPL